jgi:hypothetical protein
MAVVTMGYACPVFTLLLLRSHGARSRFGTSLTFLSWILNTIVLFLLLRNYLGFGETAVKDALRQLFVVPSCADSSVLPLCQQLTGTDPLHAMVTELNKSGVVEKFHVPPLWILSTLTLVVLGADQLWYTVGKHRSKKSKRAYLEHSSVSRSLGEALNRSLNHKWMRPVGSMGIILVVVLFCISIGYGFAGLRGLYSMGAVDIHGWSFGQVVAASFWFPVFLDVGHLYFGMQTILHFMLVVSHIRKHTNGHISRRKSTVR